MMTAAVERGNPGMRPPPADRLSRAHRKSDKNLTYLI
jgi:hypothetical protein